MEPESVKIGEWHFDPALNRILKHDASIALEPLAAAVLHHLVRNRAQLVTTNELVEAVWRRRIVGEGVVYRVVADLRKALNDDATRPRYIQTIRKRGYVLIAPVAAIPGVGLATEVEATPGTDSPTEIEATPSLDAAPETRLNPIRSRRSRRIFPVLHMTFVVIVLTIGGDSVRWNANTSEMDQRPLDASNMLRLASVQLQQNDLAKAEVLLTKAIDLLQNNREGPEYARALHSLAELNLRQHLRPAAYLGYEGALLRYERLYGRRHVNVARILLDYSTAKEWGDDPSDAERLARRAVSIFQEQLSSIQPERLASEQHLGGLLLKNGHAAAAVTMLQDAYSGYRQLYGAASPMLIDTLSELAEAHRLNGDLERARGIGSESVQLALVGYGPKHLKTARERDRLGVVLLQSGRLVEAQLQFEAALESYKALLPMDHLYVCSSEHFLAETMLANGRASDAIKQLRAALSQLHRLNAQPWRMARSESALGYALFTQGQLDEGRALLEHAYKILSAAATNAPPETIKVAYERLTKAHAGRSSS